MIVVAFIMVREGGYCMGRFLRFLAALLSVAVLIATATLQPGLFGTLGLFLAGIFIFLVGVALATARALRAAYSKPATSDFKISH
jgi:hypothetical protein